MKKIIFLAICCFGLGSLISAVAETKEESAAKEMAKYNQTGEFKKCVNYNLIKNMTVIDDSHIIFEMKHKKYFLNTLKSECRRLSFNNNFSIAPLGNIVCNKEMINVISIGGGAGPTCLLSEFEVLEKRPRSSD